MRYNSCGDRHCPRCSGSKRCDFNDRASKLIVDGVIYYQVVMTLPSELSDLALSNREVFGGLLPKSGWSSLDRSIRREQGYEAGAISVLHTWNQQLQNHWHVHLLVPGAGPSVSNDENANENENENVPRWVEATPPADARNDRGFYLVDADNLRSHFRKTFLNRLQQTRDSGKLQLVGRHAYLQDDDNWAAFTNQLKSKTWVAYIQPPPTRQSQAKHVVNYLTRYLTGGPISDHRIVSANRSSVTFLAREGKRVGGERNQVPITLSTQTFTQRWSQHIQPDQLTKVRYFGGWANSNVTAYQQRCRELAPPVLSERSDENEVNNETTDEERKNVPTSSDMVCESCGSDRMIFVSQTSKPTWRELLGYSSTSPPVWYRALRDAADKRFWDEAMGEGFNDWYLNTLTESAKEPPIQPPPLTQLHLPGFVLDKAYLVDSF